MAQRQYSFDFVLNAVLNGGFSATFTKAQQEFVRLGTEIKNLQSIQRDVASYQKQAAAVQNTTEKLDNLRRQHQLLNQQIRETTGSTTALEREKTKLEQRISNTSSALEKQRAKLDSTKERLDAAGVSTENLAGKDAELAEKIKELTEEQKKAAEEAKNFQSTGTQAIEAVAGAITAAGIAKGVREVMDAFAECTTIAADFEEQMSAVEAIADVNGSQMAALTAEAKELGATTVYTAQQSAEGMKYMAMAGWTAEDMLAGMRGMTTLAAAAGEDLGQVSDIVTDSLTAFGLKASDTAHFADVLAQAANRSNTDITIMGETFKYSAAVAGALGYSIEDVSTMIGLMANSGIKGSIAGTSLRNIFNGLLEDITLTSNAFGEVEYSAINADGTMKGLAETVSDLRGYFSQMTESEQVTNALNIAGMRGYNGLLAIVNSTEEDFNNLYRSINDCTGAAERMAKVKLDNLNGDVTLMNSAMEALQSTIGEQFSPEMRELTQLGTEGLNWMNQFIQDSPALAKGAMAGAGAIGAMGAAIVGVNAAIHAFKALNLATVMAGPATALLGPAAAIAGVTALVVGLNEAFRDGGPAVRALTQEAIGLSESMGQAKDTMEETMASSLAAAEVADIYIDRLDAMGDTASMTEEEHKRYQNTLAMLLEVMPSLSEDISVTTDEYGRSTYALNTSTDALRRNTDAWRENAKAQAYQEYMNSLTEDYNDVMKEAVENELGMVQAQAKIDEANQRRTQIYERMNELRDEARKKAAQENQKRPGRSTRTEDYLPQEYKDLQDELIEVNGELVDASAELDAHKKAMERDAEAIAAAEAAIEGAESAYEKLTGAMEDGTDAQWNAEKEYQDFQSLMDDTTAAAQNLAEAYKEAYNAAYESFQGQFGLFDEAKADVEATVAAAQTALDTQNQYWTAYAQNIAALKEISAEDLGITQQNYDLLMQYVRTGTPEAAGLAENMVQEINKGNTRAIANLANTLGEIEESQRAASEHVADWTSGLTEQMDQLIADMQIKIEELDLSPEAAIEAEKTIQSYIDKAQDMTSDVQAAYAKLRAAARSALMGSIMPEDGGWNATPRILTPSEITNRLMQTVGFASGTESAPPGWAWVGEEGPELMRMHGGEQILPADVSRRVAEDYNAYNRYTAAQGTELEIRTVETTERTVTAMGTTRVELNFHIASGAAPETVEAWQDYASRGGLKEAILEALEDVDTDRRRRVTV